MKIYRLTIIFLSFVIFFLFGYVFITQAFANPTGTPPSGGDGVISISEGGTGATTTAQALANLGAAASGANSDITSLTPLTGNPLQIGNAGFTIGSSLFGTDQGGNIELGGNNSTANPVSGGIPYIDFHYGTGTAQDYNVRIINNANNSLGIYANGSLTLNVGSTSTDSMIVGGGLGTLKVGTLTFSDGTSQTTAATGIPSGLDILSASQTAPSGYTYTGNYVFYGSTIGLTWINVSSVPGLSWLQDPSLSSLNNVIYIMGSSNGGNYELGCSSGSGFTYNYAYNPITNTWTTEANLPYGNCGFAAVADPSNGLIYEIGGSWYNTNGWCLACSTSNVYAYNPATNAWTAEAPLPIAEKDLGGVFLNGLIYVTGGYNGSCLANTYAYNPSTNSWTAEASPPVAACVAGYTSAGGLLYMVGGYTNTYPNGTELSSVYAYNPSTNSWATKASLPITIATPAVASASGIVYVMGGYSATNSAVTSTVYAYNPSTNSWTQETPMPNPGGFFNGAFANGNIYTAGNENGSDTGIKVWQFSVPSLYYLMSKN